MKKWDLLERGSGREVELNLVKIIFSLFFSFNSIFYFLR